MDTIASNPRLSAAAQSFIANEHKLLIDGKWVPAKSGKTFAVVDPSSGGPIARVAEADAVDVDAAVASARRAFDSGPWTRMAPSQRGKLLWRLAELLEQHNGRRVRRDPDRSTTASRSRWPVSPTCRSRSTCSATWAAGRPRFAAPRSRCPCLASIRSYTLREPVGVVGQIIPWNFPLLMAAWKLGPALATGCSGAQGRGADAAVGAPSRRPDPGRRIPRRRGQHPHRLRRDRGRRAHGAPRRRQGRVHRLDQGRQAHRQGRRQGSQAVDAGGSAASRRRSCSPTPTSAARSAAPPMPSSSTTASAAAPGRGSTLTRACSIRSSKACRPRLARFASGGSRPRHRHGSARLRGAVPAGDRLPRGRPVGRCDVLAGGGTPKERGYFVEPTVLTNTNPDMKVIREEIFGPVVRNSYGDEDLEQIAKEANATTYGLAASVWTKDISRPIVWLPGCARARSGSTATTCSTPRCRSVVTRSRAGAVRWASSPWRTISR